MTPPTPARFGDEFVARWRDRWEHRPSERPLTYDTAVNDEFAERRAWYGQQIDLLPEAAAAGMTDRLWQGQHNWPGPVGFGAGGWVGSARVPVAVGHQWEGPTPR